jgi:hypothetical protein
MAYIKLTLRTFVNNNLLNYNNSYLADNYAMWLVQNIYLEQLSII